MVAGNAEGRDDLLVSFVLFPFHSVLVPNLRDNRTHVQGGFSLLFVCFLWQGLTM